MFDTPIAEIKRTTSISDVAARYAEVRPHGRLRACRCLCGQNSDRTPSFVLYDDDNHFHCFACARHGSVIDLVMLAENVDFRAALQSLRAQVGAPSQALPSSVPLTPPRRDIDPAVREALAAAAAHYHATLLRNASARRYLQARGLNDATIAALQLGYADGTLAGALRTGGIDLALAARIGLYVARGELLIGRIVAPVADAHGPAWLIGRALAARHRVKYLGLPGGLTHKLPLRHGHAHDGAIVVEGVFDLAALLQWDFGDRHALIALLGTATARGFDELLALPDGAPIHLALDQDDAGRRAAHKLADGLAAQGRIAHVLNWPGAKDCGELLARGEAGRAVFDAALCRTNGR